MENYNGTFHFTNGFAKIAPSFNPITVLTHDSVLWFLNHEANSIVANFHIHGGMSDRNKKVLEKVLESQKNIDVYTV